MSYCEQKIFYTALPLFKCFLWPGAWLHLYFYIIVPMHTCIQVGLLFSECTGTLQVLPTRDASTQCYPIGQGIFPGVMPESDSSSVNIQSTEGTVCWANTSMCDSSNCLHCVLF